MEKREDNSGSLHQQLEALLKGERDWLANLANASALIYAELSQINWAGFYLLREGQLILGPFQGLPACIRIELGRGVCGMAAQERKTYLVEDVHQFPGHIACDAASRSELVIPLIKEERLLGVLDIDSPVKDRFTTEDRENLEEFSAILLAGTDFGKIPVD